MGITDADLIKDARDSELKALFVTLHREIAAGNAGAAQSNFMRGLQLLTEAERIALSIINGGKPNV